MPPDLPDIVDVVVLNRVALVDVLCARAVADQENARAADAGDLVARDPISLTVQVQANRRSAGVGERAVDDLTFFGPARSPQKGTRM